MTTPDTPETLADVRARAAAHHGQPATHIATVAEHPAGRVVTFADGARVLVSPTVVRAYAPDVDDQGGEPEPAGADTAVTGNAAKSAAGRPSARKSAG